MARTPEGFLLCLGVSIARTGVMDYTEEELEDAEIEGDANGIVKMSRDEKEVFRPETIASFEGKPFTIRHPEGLVTPETWQELANGVIKNVRRGKGENSNDLVADILVTTIDAIHLVESEGMREVSCGYEADYEQTGVGKGRQSNIIGNHLALVEQGRAGSGYAIHDHKGAKFMDFKKIFAPFMKDPEAVKALRALVADGKTKTKTVDCDDEDPGAVTEDAPPWADKLMKTISDLNTSVSNMAQPTVQDEDEDDGKAKSKDADPMKKVMDMLDALGKRMDAFEKKKTDDEDETDDEESEEDVVSEDEESGEEGEETDDGAGPEVISDAASRIEILAPGADIDPDSKSAKVQALKACHATKDGKKVMEALSGGKKPVFTDKKTVDHLFVAVSEILKAKRTRKNAKTKFADKELIDGTPESKVMTAEKMNELNAKYYGQKTH